MKSIILILLAYWIFTVFMRRGRGRSNNSPLPHPGQNRPAPQHQQDRQDIPSPEDDMPLRGPWSRRPEPVDMEQSQSPIDEYEHENEYGYEHDRVPPNPTKQPEVILVGDDAVVVRRDTAAKPHGTGGSKSAPAGEQSAAVTQSHNQADPFTRILHRKSTLAAGIILGEVLGSRGGRQKQLRRRY